MSKGWGGRRVMTLRRQWQARIIAGDVHCARCGLLIYEGERWDIGHQVDRALGGRDADGLLPEHASCNRAAGGRLGHELRRRSSAPPPLVKRRSWT